jgi:hypothetical protein
MTCAVIFEHGPNEEGREDLGRIRARFAAKLIARHTPIGLDALVRTKQASGRIRQWVIRFGVKLPLP